MTANLDVEDEAQLLFWLLCHLLCDSLQEIQKQRLATKTHNHTHYESRRQAANNRTRIGGRFQKKNHDEHKAADERTLGPEGARCKRKATNGQTLVLDEDRDERKAAKAPRVQPKALDGTSLYKTVELPASSRRAS